MKEYWVNIYDDYAIGACCVNRVLAKEISRKLSYMINCKIIYRIHVKMKDKPLMHQRAGRIKRPLTTHWMDD